MSVLTSVTAPEISPEEWGQLSPVMLRRLNLMTLPQSPLFWSESATYPKAISVAGPLGFFNSENSYQVHYFETFPVNLGKLRNARELS